MRIIISLLLLTIYGSLYCQSPEKFKYQSIIRDGSGNIISEQDISMKINIIEGNTNGIIIYSENHSVTTNKFGLVNIEIGSGNIETGNFNLINWGGNSYFINVQIDIQGGLNWIDAGTTQLVSVPYALYAKSSGDKHFSKNTANHLYYNDGRIGIGTANPQKALHIRRVTDNGQGIGQAQLLVEADSESDATIYLGYYPNDSYITDEGSFWRINSHKPNGDFSIADETDNNPGGDGSEKRFVIKKNTGNVGIGVENPARKLHISEAMRLEPQATAPSDPVMGDIYFGTDGKLHLFNGEAWHVLNMTQE
ncbi:hypothetical protein [Plebeiibacterium marinum]|uniref:Uncharacterized protein n=1 Tax=Plebeiibacterium marinum TaxID=2992111 RepID=A0AAE3MGY0_9BACT|nr:hypothetical protein [Plebeiobacterium marinum]MCW3807589.1 hypothetical protein [Plebeiobacterium marinum]